MSALPLAEIKNLLATKTLPALGPGPRSGVLSERELDAQLIPVLAGAKFSHQPAQLIRALVLLWHDHLDTSHQISQGIGSVDGSFVHAIMHRREPDYWNAKYWWRRVGAHPAFTTIAAEVKGLLPATSGGLGRQLLPAGKWDACAFVDLCETAASDPTHSDLLQEIQRIETIGLLESLLVSRI